MDGIDFVVAVSANQQQVPHIRPGQQILEQIERCYIEPLEIVEEQGERMFRPREYADKSPEHQPKTALRILWRQLGDRWLFADDVLQFRDEINNEPTVRFERLEQRLSPLPQLRFGLAQKRTDQALKGLRKGEVRDVALVLVKLARCKKTAGRNKWLMKLVDDRGLADAGVSGNQHQLRPAASDDTVERGKQAIDLGCPTIQFLGDQQPVRSVVFPWREIVDIAPGFPFSKAMP
ncbi:hypothetical protein ACVW0I_007845 [Bradyrhizobium sp. LM6.11]